MECGGGVGRMPGVPTILRIGRFRFFFYSGDRTEPAHVHVEAGNGVAKFWLNPVRLAGSRGIPRHELSRVQQLVVEHRGILVRAWHAYFDG
jgi:hypothetical protein